MILGINMRFWGQKKPFKMISHFIKKHNLLPGRRRRRVSCDKKIQGRLEQVVRNG